MQKALPNVVMRGYAWFLREEFAGGAGGVLLYETTCIIWHSRTTPVGRKLHNMASVKFVIRSCIVHCCIQLAGGSVFPIRAYA
jgi:hypothetical protein